LGVHNRRGHARDAHIGANLEKLGTNWGEGLDSKDKPRGANNLAPGIKYPNGEPFEKSRG